MEQDQDIHGCLEIALVDALLAPTDHDDIARTQLIGTIREKAENRAIMLSELAIQLSHSNRRTDRQMKVGMVGVVGSVVKELHRGGFEVAATELDETLVDIEVDGMRVRHGKETPSMVENCDLAIVTGMTLASNTLGSVLKASKAGSTPLLFFAQSGVNILRTLEFPTQAIVVSESFPHYMWPGVTDIGIRYFDASDLVDTI
jgi:hypothetical protein